MTRKKEDIYSGKNGMLYLRTDSGGIALTDAVKRLYGGELGGIGAQYASAIGAEGEITPSGLIEQYSSALGSGAAARTGAALERIGASAEQADREFDEAARGLYAQKSLSEKAMANRLSSSGLYNSGYSDSARIALENQYARGLAENEAARVRSADEHRLAGLELLAGLSEESLRAEAEAAKLALGQLNEDRDHALALERLENERADAERDHALVLQKYLDSRADADREFALQQEEQEASARQERWERIRAEKAYADSRADIEWEREQKLAEAKNKQAKEALDEAYAAAEMGDFSKLDALGVDTSCAREAYRAELELLMLKLADARNDASGGGGSSSGGSSSSGKPGTASPGRTEDPPLITDGEYGKELADSLAGRLVENMLDQGKTYPQVLEYIASIRPGLEKQFGESFWEEYVKAVSEKFPGGSRYTEPEHASSIKSVVDFINEPRNLTRFFAPDGYDKEAIREFVEQTDLSDAERREVLAYYGIS